MVDFFFQCLCTFAHFSYKLPRCVSFCPEYHPKPPIFTQPSQTPFRDIYVHKTPPTPPQNTHFSGLNLKVAK